MTPETTSPLKIRRFQREDIVAMVTLFHDTIHEVAIRNYTPAQVEAWAPAMVNVNYEGWTRRMEAAYTVVAEWGGVVVGFSTLEADGHVGMMYVHQNHQRAGIARALMEAIKTEARRLHHPSLYTEASLTARPFFERMGFTVVKEQQVPMRGQLLTNFKMDMRLPPA